MSEKLPISLLKGFNGGRRPELVENEQATELINLRFHRRGALATRNGVRMFAVPTGDGEQIGVQAKGATAIGEYVLEEWDSDTDCSRFMFYGVRGSTLRDAGDGDRIPPQYDLSYILVPEEGSNRNRITGGSAVVLTTRQLAGGGADSALLSAPRRQVTGLSSWSSDGRLKDENWITHYAAVHQYRNMMVISDRVNGDMLLCDRSNDAPVGKTYPHEFYLRQNCVGTFNIDSVTIDFGLNTGGFNRAGVSSGMALYKFYLPRKAAIITDDNYAEYFSGTQDVINEKLKALGKGGAVQEFATAGTFMVAGFYFDAADSDILDDLLNTNVFHDANSNVYRGLGVNAGKFTFSDISDPVEIDDLFGRPTLTNPLVDGEKERAADVYLWDDVQLTYYPCSGTEQGAGYLRPRDRKFDKTAPLLPKLIKPSEHTGAAEIAPLGVWSYRFVWDFGNGEYSAPSAPLTVPDMLWSAMADESDPALTGEEYQRPVRIDSESEAVTTPAPAAHKIFAADSVFLSGSATHNARPLVFNGSTYSAPHIEDALTDYGKLFRMVKEALYTGASHRFGTLSAYTTTLEFADAMEFGVIATAYFGAGTKPLTGVFCESAYSFLALEEKAFGDGGFSYGRYAVTLMPLLVPLFAGNNQETYNAVFTDRGVPRRAFQAPNPALPLNANSVPPYQLVLWGYSYAANQQWVGDAYDNNFGWAWALPSASVGVHFNVVPQQGGTFVDKNNIAETSEYSSGVPLGAARDPSQFRAVTSERDRLTYIGPDVPAEVATRLLVRGTAELLLCDWGDKGTITGATKDGGEFGSTGDGQRVLTDILGHEPGGDGEVARRRFTPIAETFPAWSFAWSWYENATYFDEDTGFVSGRNSSGYCGPILTGLPGTTKYVALDNLRVAIHGDGERLLLPEQLTAYFPSSLLWKAPRVKLKIAAADIPPRAQQLLIFRTRATHDNNWQPDDYGLCSTIKVPTDGSDMPEDIEFFDTIKDADLNFSVTPGEYAGLTQPIASRFAITLNEQTHYANFRQSYRPQAPRDNIATINGNSISRAPMFNVTSGGKLAAPRNVVYALLHKDAAGVYSAPVLIAPTPGGGLPPITLGEADIVILSLVPPASDGETCEVWRGIESGGSYTWGRIGEAGPKDEGIFIDDDNEILEEWSGSYIDDIEGGILTTSDKVENHPSGLRPSEPYQPFLLKPEKLYPVRGGDGTQITGLASLGGQLIVFKERSIYRIAVQSSGPTVYSRPDEVSGSVGCIAPNTIIGINSHVYFLSWSGLMRYDGNSFEKADGDFWDELSLRLKRRSSEASGSLPHPGVRDASCAYNVLYNEVYLNVPIYRHGDTIANDPDGLNSPRLIRGNVYVLNLDTGFVTKFHYEEPDGLVAQPEDRTAARLYYTTSLGELRSAAVLAQNFDSGLTGFYLEAPTETFADALTTYSEIGGDNVFDTAPVQTLWRSKYFDFGDKSIIKRALKFIVNVRKSGGTVRVSGGSANEHYQSRAHEEERWWSYDFPVGHGELAAIPPRAAHEPPNSGYDGSAPPQSQHPERGERLVFQVEGEGDMFLDGFAVHWKPVTPYLR